MRPKGFPAVTPLVIITGASGCDNAAFDGARVERYDPFLAWYHGAWAMAFHDPCGLPVAPEAIRTFP